METSELVATMERSPSIVVPMVRSADPAHVKQRPASGKWSIHEHACHLAEVHPLFFERLDKMLSVDDPEIQSYEPGRDDAPDRLLSVDLEEALERFQSDRARLVEKVRALSPSDWERTARHDEYKSYSIFVMFRHLVLHDFFHAYRIEDLLLRKA